MADPNHSVRLGHMRRRLLRSMQHLRDAETACYAKRPEDALAECDAVRALMVEFDAELSSFEGTMALFAFSQANNPTPRERRQAQRDQDEAESQPVKVVARAELPAMIDEANRRLDAMVEITARPLSFAAAFEEATNA